MKDTEIVITSTGGTDDGTGAGNPPNAGETVQFTPAQQAHIDNIVTERLQRGKAKWEADAAETQRKATEAAEAAQLAAQQKWQELAEKREAEIRSLEGQLAEGKTREGRLTRLEAALTAQLETQRAGLPAHLLLLLDKMPVEEQLEYLAANAAALRPVGAGAGIPATPAAQGTTGLTDEQRRENSASVRDYW